MQAACNSSTMTAWTKLIFIIFAHVFLATQASFIQLNNGNYDDIVIAIHPGLSEDDTLIQKIKEMVMEASTYLFHATENRLSIGHVKILLPLSWTSQNTSEARTRETYEKADIIISNPFMKYSDSPYTVQYRGCGEHGEYINLTPDYLLNISLSSAYGSPGRTFVHEWAHLRWGVYDEYNEEIPYYFSREHKVEATRCSVSLKGRNIIEECTEKFCSLRECNIDSDTGLYEQGCLFLPEKDQDVQESIMYSAALNSITLFCNDSSHNIEAPNLQNRMCNCRSTWDIIQNSTDIISTAPRSDTNLPVPTFTLIQYRRRVITLACDISGSMGRAGRIDRLYQGAEFFLTQIVETGTYVGIVEFATFAFARSQLLQINNEEDRATLVSQVPSTTTNENANICEGIQEALKTNKVNGSTAGTEVLLVADGESDFSNCMGEISASGAVIHIIAVGSEASRELERIAHMTGGQTHFVTDTSNTNDLFHVFSAISNQNGDETSQSILLESRSSTLESEGCLNSGIFIDSTVGTSTFFLVTWQVAEPSILLQDPNGNTYNETQFTNNTQSHSSRLQIPGNAEIGAWNYTICSSLKTRQVVGMIVTSKPASNSVPPIIVNVQMNKDTNDYPSPMIIYASVHQGLLPVTNLSVAATVQVESSNTVTIELLDNGAGADVFKNDGVYSRYFTSFSEKGRYNLKVRVETQEIENRLALPRNRALYIPGYVDNDGESMNPPRPSVNNDDLHITVGPISRTASGGSFIVNKVPTKPQVIDHKPCKITDLEASAQGDSVTLSWTATGDDLDQGQASQYDLRMSTNPRDLRDNFKNSTQVDLSSLTPQLFGSQEKFTFALSNMMEENGIVLYFALTATDQNNLESDVSNIAQTAIFTSTSTTPESSSVSTETIPNITSFQTSTSVSPPSTFSQPNSTSILTSDTVPSTEMPSTDFSYTTDMSTTTVENSSPSHSSLITPFDYSDSPASTTEPTYTDTLMTTNSTVFLTTYTPSLDGNFSESTSSPTDDNGQFTGTSLPPTGSSITPTASIFQQTLSTDYSNVTTVTPTYSTILQFTGTTLPPTGSSITPTTSIFQPTHSTDYSNVTTVTPTYSTILPTVSTLSPDSSSVPTGSIFTSTVDILSSITSLSTPTNNNDTIASSTSIPSTTFTEPTNEYNTTMTDNSVTPTDFTTDITTQKTGGNASVTVTENMLTNSSVTNSTFHSMASTSPPDINVPAIVAIVCVSVVIICIIICLTIFLVKYCTTGSYSSIAA